MYRDGNIKKIGGSALETSTRAHNIQACPLRGLLTKPVLDLQLVEVVTKGWHGDLQVLALAYCQRQFLHLALFHAITWHVVPVVEHALWESLSACLLTQRCDETERLSDRKVRPGLDERSSLALVLLEDTTSAHVHAPC